MSMLRATGDWAAPPSLPTPAPPCDLNSILNATDSCAYAEFACADVGRGSFGSYVVHWFCAFHGNAFGMLPLGMWLLAVMLALCSTADVFLMPQLNYISELLKLKPDVAGVTLLAFGNGAADIFTGIAVVTRNPYDIDYSLMLSYQTGAIVFIVTIVIGVIAYIADKHVGYWRVSKAPFFRDTLCFLIAISIVIGASSTGTIATGESVLFLLMYVIYVAFVVLLRYYIQPCWPDDTFGEFLGDRAKRASRTLARTKVAKRARVGLERAASRLPPTVRQNSSRFLQSARQGLLGSMDVGGSSSTRHP